MKVENKYLSSIFNFFDLPIRFIYARTGFLSALLNKAMFWKLYSSDFKALDEKFEHMFSQIEKADYSIEDKVVLELGPGNSHINAFNFLLKGAKKVILVDKYSRQIEGQKQKDFFNKEVSFVTEKYGLDRPYFIDENNQLKKEFIEYVEGDILEMDLDVDFIVSISVMEHVEHPERVVKKMAKMLPEGGGMFHHIDMRDHYNFNSPFLFYKYSDRVWNSLLTKVGRSYTNRARYDEFKRWFVGSDLDILLESIERLSLGGVKTHTQFMCFKHLDAGRLDVVLKK